MDNPRPEKVAVVTEVKERLEGASAAVVTEYRGLTVAQLKQLRNELETAGADYKIFKNTLVRRATSGTAYESMNELMTGPTAIAFVNDDVSAVAKTLREFAKANEALIIKGGMFDGAVLSAAQLAKLADLPSREVLLARLAGAFQAPMAQMAGLLQALPRGLAYGIKALIDQGGGVPEAPAPAAQVVVEEAPAPEAEVAEEADATVEAEAPAAEAPAEAEAEATAEAEVTAEAE